MNKVVFFILAGGRGTRLAPLTDDLPKPLVQFGFSNRLIDFTLYNCLISSGNDITLLTQQYSGMIEEYVMENWRRPFTNQGGNLRITCGNDSRKGCFSGTADAVYQALTESSCQSKFIVVLAADHVYRMDYRSLIDFHIKHGRTATVCTVACEREQAHRFGIINNGSDGAIGSFFEKPRSLEGIIPSEKLPLASMGIYVFSTVPLIKHLKKNQRKSSHDFARDVLPDIVVSREALAYRFLGPDGKDNYWRDVGDLSAYKKAGDEFFNGQYKRLTFDKTPTLNYSLTASFEKARIRKTPEQSHETNFNQTNTSTKKGLLC